MTPTASPIVLFVDDGSGNRVVFRHSFGTKLDVRTVASGAEALEVPANEHVGVPVTDQRMPEMSGNDLLARVKQERPRIVPVMVTA